MHLLSSPGKWSFRSLSPHRFLASAGMAMVLFVSGTASAISGNQFTLYWPHDSTTELPAWLNPPSQSKDSAFAAIHLPVLPGASEEDADLAVTVYFVEPGDGFLRLFWVTSEEEVMLSSNLYEGVATAHQRTVVLPRGFLNSPGLFTLQASTGESPVYAVRFEWLKSRQVAAPAEVLDPAIQLSTGQLLNTREIAGLPYIPPSSGWQGDVVTVSLSDKIEKIENGAEFPSLLDQVPAQARLSMRLAGADLTQPILIWVNGVYAGFLNVETPVLTDEGYYEDATGGNHYAGWRMATVFLPGKIFHVGDNSIQIGYTQEPNHLPAARDIQLQMRFPDALMPAKIPSGAETLGPAPEFMLLDQVAPRPEFRFE